MGVKIWRAEAPSNIALIKYMGKTDATQNQPSNASLSFTLDHLVSVVEVEESLSCRDFWAPLLSEEMSPIQLSAKSQERFISHFQFLKSAFKIPGHYKLRSANTFPSDCGLASSASSFAALTKAAHHLALERGEVKSEIDGFQVEDLSALSRKGSGSSCRSFFRPWALWRGEAAEEVHLPYTRLHHQVLVLEKEKKLVSSSEAHSRVTSSALFQGRVARAENRLKDLMSSLSEQNWAKSFELAWSEFWDMHALFETSVPSFGYMTPKSMKALDVVRKIWIAESDGPLATMDAGANVHLLYRMDQTALAKKIENTVRDFADVISSPSLSGESR